MTYQCFDFSIDQKIAHLRFNRPDSLNTMQPVFFRELVEILQKLQREASARVLIISSTGKHFTAGMALDVFRQRHHAGR
jgi:enoyl-CoA hydratase